MQPSVAIAVHLDEATLHEIMADDVRRGLTSPQKTLPPKYFYDARGSQLFEQITELPEYYPSRTELAILQAIAPGLANEFRYAEVVELGSGSSTKTTTVLDALDQLGTLVSFVPFDVSETILRESADILIHRYPALAIRGVVGDFQRHLSMVPAKSGPRLVIFLGSTIGNLYPSERRTLLTGVRQLLGSDDHLMIGLDLVKGGDVLHAAYNDSAGVTAEFNKNVLYAVNNILHANFNPEAFWHLSFYNEPLKRVEMHLVASVSQDVHVADLALDISLSKNETIFTEISTKFTKETVSEMLDDADLMLTRWFTDPDELFALVLASRS